MTGIATETSRRSSREAWMVVGVILVVFAAALLLVSQRLRSELRRKIIQQDGIALGAAMMVSPSLIEDLGTELANDPEVVFSAMADKVLQATKLKEVIAVRVFDQTGELQFAIAGGKSELTPDQLTLTDQQLTQLREGKAINSSFEPRVKLSEIVDHNSDTETALVRSIVPLVLPQGEGQDGMFIGAAEFTSDGREVAAALQKLDRELLLYSGLIFFMVGGFTTGAILWAFRRLEGANKLLAERTRSLLRANHELTLSAKTSAIGAITAHLIHDLKNPLFGLQSFVSARGSTEEEDWNIAQNTTERMQRVIGEIVRILQEEKTTEKYELTIEELFALLRTKLQPQCASAGITFKTDCDASGSVMNRDANIILLVITNIVQNAIQATPRGGEISVRAAHAADCMLFTMRDTGPGLPESIRSTLFTPSRSTKAGGSGLGLAISKQLANHISADLVLKETSRAGTVFELRVPDRVVVGELV
jgi:signal transduction histidine kinase